MNILKAEKIDKFYNQGKTVSHVLKKISLEINKGDFLGIVGPSGSGKTTLLYCLSSIEEIDNGNVFINGQNYKNMKDNDISELRQSEFGFVFQFYNLIPNLTAYENILLASVIAEKVDENRIDELIELVGMSKYKKYFPNELSGGMQQRVAIARALVNNPKILFADEPTGNLDQKKGKEIMDLLKTLNEEKGITIVLVTHNEDYLKYCNRTINLVDGEIIE
ncbi:MAG: ABC transporter ATP-binding protein [Candidatus Izemoplasmatales bacterium]